MIIFNNNSIGYVLDVDASKVIEAVRSTGVTITPAMMHYAHYLISNMKNIGTWQLSNAVYGFVGGTAASHKFNWKDLRDVDAAFRLVFSNISHDNTGTRANSFNSFTNTFLNANSTNFPSPSICIGFYAPDNTSTLFGGAGVRFSGADATCANFDGSFISTLLTSTSFQLVVPIAFNKGMYLSNRVNASTFKIWKDGVNISSDLNTRSIIYPNANIYLNNLSGEVFYGSSKKMSFAFISSSFTDTQAIQQSQIVTNAQAILNRL